MASNYLVPVTVSRRFMLVRFVDFLEAQAVSGSGM